jgi:hypothetical protein
MQQLAIAVIDQMKQVKVISNPPRHPRIIPEPVEEAINVEENRWSRGRRTAVRGQTTGVRGQRAEVRSQ